MCVTTLIVLSCTLHLLRWPCLRDLKNSPQVQICLSSIKIKFVQQLSLGVTMRKWFRWCDPVACWGSLHCATTGKYEYAEKLTRNIVCPASFLTLQLLFLGFARCKKHWHFPYLASKRSETAVSTLHSNPLSAAFCLLFCAHTDTLFRMTQWSCLALVNWCCYQEGK